jgi:hypothetical protein
MRKLAKRGIQTSPLIAHTSIGNTGCTLTTESKTPSFSLKEIEFYEILVVNKLTFSDYV